MELIELSTDEDKVKDIVSRFKSFKEAVAYAMEKHKVLMDTEFFLAGQNNLSTVIVFRDLKYGKPELDDKARIEMKKA